MTCCECARFRAAVSPNPTQAWGYCGKKKKGRYGAATVYDNFQPKGKEEYDEVRID